MQIQTKYNIGDIVYMSTGLNIIEYRIVNISIRIYKIDEMSTQVTEDTLYTIEDKTGDYGSKEYDFKLFKTKEECKQDMIERINKL